MSKLALLDRDGVINVDRDDYIREPEAWEPLPGSIAAIAALTAAGWHIAVCTNQSGIARGLLDTAALDAIHQRMCASVTAAGGRIGAIYICPHGPEALCPCRKPEPGLVCQALKDYGVGGERTWLIGDSMRDLVAGTRAGVHPVLVLTGNGLRTAEALNDPVPVYDDLWDAVQGLLGPG